MCPYTQYLKCVFLLCEINKYHNRIYLEMRKLRREVMWRVQGHRVGQ